MRKVLPIGIVPNKYSKEFANSPTNNIATEVGKTKSASIYKIQQS